MREKVFPEERKDKMKGKVFPFIKKAIPWTVRIKKHCRYCLFSCWWCWNKFIVNVTLPQKAIALLGKGCQVLVRVVPLFSWGHFCDVHLLYIYMCVFISPLSLFTFMEWRGGKEVEVGGGPSEKSSSVRGDSASRASVTCLTTAHRKVKLIHCQGRTAADSSVFYHPTDKRTRTDCHKTL